MSSRTRVLVLGAGFAGLELMTRLSDHFGSDIDVTLIDEGEGFRFGFSKLDVMFGKAPYESTLMPYADIDKPGVTFRRETVLTIDPETRTVTTNGGTYTGDYLVVAMGAGYDLDATPGLAESGSEFYSYEGAAATAPRLAAFTGGRVVVGVCGAPYKCPPAPSECALLMHDYLVDRGLRETSPITFLIPFQRPVPPSPQASDAIVAALEDRGIEYRRATRVARVENERNVVITDDGSEVPFDLLLTVPKHCAPKVVVDAGMTEDGYIPVDGRTLRTRYEKVFAVGDVATVGTPKAGVFAERQAAIVADAIIAELGGGESDSRYDGIGDCYMEFGFDQVARVHVDFFTHENPTGSLHGPGPEYVAEKAEFGSSRKARWFGKRTADQLNEQLAAVD